MAKLSEVCKEIWLESPNGAALCALINDNVGWLMYIPQPGDAGFSSRNPSYIGPQEAEIAYLLTNGQLDYYPASWALPLEKIEIALDYFRTYGKQSPDIVWHDDGNSA